MRRLLFICCFATFNLSAAFGGQYNYGYSPQHQTSAPFGYRHGGQSFLLNSGPQYHQGLSYGRNVNYGHAANYGQAMNYTIVPTLTRVPIFIAPVRQVVVRPAPVVYAAPPVQIVEDPCVTPCAPAASVDPHKQTLHP